MYRMMALLGLVLSMLGGCASYTTPGRGADFSSIGVQRENGTDPMVRKAINVKPLAQFPTALAVVRIQSSGYRHSYCSSWGSGAYSIVTTREVETEAQLARVGRLPLVTGIAPLNRLLFPEKLESAEQLRQAAGMVHADMLMVYTFDTTFHDDENAMPLSVVTLGLSPTKSVRVATTASAVVMDTRTGYLYGLAETTVKRNKLTSAWSLNDTMQEAQKNNEKEAFVLLIGELEKTWAGIVNQYALRPTTPEGARYDTVR